MIHSNATSKPQEVVIRAKNIVNSFRVGTLQGRTNDSIKPINPSNSICKMFFFFLEMWSLWKLLLCKKEFNLPRTLGWSSYN